MAGADPDVVEAYRSYLQRFEDIAGSGDFGSFVKHNGRLIKKMRYEEFEPKYLEYRDVAQAYHDSIRRGDTINDLIVKILRERGTELILESPA